MNNFSFEFTPTELSADGTVLYIANHLSPKPCPDLNIYKNMSWNPLLLRLRISKCQISLLLKYKV